MKLLSFLYPQDSQCEDSAASDLLLLLLAADIFFICLHFLTQTRYGSPLFSLEVDGSYSELFDYIKEFWIIILFVSMFVRKKITGFLVWSGLFLYLLLDDSLRIHEVVGGYISTELGLHSLLSLRGKDFGELAVSALVGGVFFSLLSVFYIKGTSLFKRASRHLVLFLFCIAFFGVFVDMIHMVIKGDIITFVLGVVEDGGEMIVMSVIVWYVFLINLRACKKSLPSAG
jgi:hypothetical protein